MQYAQQTGHVKWELAHEHDTVAFPTGRPDIGALVCIPQDFHWNASRTLRTDGFRLVQAHSQENGAVL
jgi:hypothetical protein